ncbi:MAG: hypothetical protein EOS21_13545 [Mesorhizobium sp.]|nr:MAG: hypothetical protein EOS21_13545 [Mesorhizobium sp.]
MPRTRINSSLSLEDCTTQLSPVGESPRSVDIQVMPACKWRLLRFRCSRTQSTLRSGSRKPPFSARPDLNINRPRSARGLSRTARHANNLENRNTRQPAGAGAGA